MGGWDSVVSIATCYGLFFWMHPDLLWHLPNCLYNGYRVSLLGTKRLWHDADHPHPSSEGINLYLPSMPAWHIRGHAFFNLYLPLDTKYHTGDTLWIYDSTANKKFRLWALCCL